MLSRGSSGELPTGSSSPKAQAEISEKDRHVFAEASAGETQDKRGGAGGGPAERGVFSPSSRKGKGKQKGDRRSTASPSSLDVLMRDIEADDDSVESRAVQAMEEDEVGVCRIWRWRWWLGVFFLKIHLFLGWGIIVVLVSLLVFVERVVDWFCVLCPLSVARLRRGVFTANPVGFCLLR